jgi:peptide/nickel transport system ATP-binding protein
VRSGETFGLVGESGCGKTTLGRLIVGLQKPTSGVIRFGDEDVTALRGSRLRTSRRYRQLMFQDPFASLDPRMRVEATLREPLSIQSFGTRVDRNKRIRQLLGEVGLPERALDLYPHELSGGQRQRVGLARALMLNPRLLVADEPVSALDVSIQAQVLNLMKVLQERHALTSVVISHDLAVIRFLADRIGVMYLGEIVEIGRAADIYERPAHPYTRGLLDAIPRPAPAEARRHRKLNIKGELPSAITPPSGCRFHTRCPRAQEICAEVAPRFSSFGEEHEATCHFPLLPATVDRTDSSYAAQS